MKKLILVPLAAAGILVVLTSSIAFAGGPPRIFLAAGHGYVVALKLEDGKPWVLAVAAEGHCLVTAEEEGASDTEFLEGFRAPKPLLPGTIGLKASALEGGLWESKSSAVDQVVFGATVDGRFEAHSSGEGQPNCISGEPEDPGFRVPFEAVEYVPVSDLRAGDATPDQTPFYYAHASGLEIYMWATPGYVAGIRGAASSVRCHGPLPDASLRHQLFLFDRPASAGLIDRRRFRLFAGYGGRRAPDKESRELTGALVGDAIVGSFHRREVGQEKSGRWSCEVPRTTYEAVRYVPAVAAPSE